MPEISTFTTLTEPERAIRTYLFVVLIKRNGNFEHGVLVPDHERALIPQKPGAPAEEEGEGGHGLEGEHVLAGGNSGTGSIVVVSFLRVLL
jgi:hypothetical protein